MTAAFARYAELHSPCWIETEVLGENPGNPGDPGDPGDPGETTVRVSGRQDGESVFSATLTCAQPARVRSLS
jgi:hypothetical protein